MAVPIFSLEPFRRWMDACKHSTVSASSIDGRAHVRVTVRTRAGMPGERLRRSRHGCRAARPVPAENARMRQYKRVLEYLSLYGIL